MKAAISIEHPAWAWQFRQIIDQVNQSGETLVLAVEKDGCTQLLASFGLPYHELAETTGNNILEKGWLFLRLCLSYTQEIRSFHPDIMIGRASPMMAVAAFLSRTPHLIFEDTEVSRFSLLLCRLFSKKIITPERFMVNLGIKQERLPIYKELFYLHEKEFQPDKTQLANCGIDLDRPYIIVRFISWKASHDFGKNGLESEEKIRFIRQLLKLGNVYISSEDVLPTELEKYKLNTPYDLIHQVLYYATLVISEGASMASEAAILGTHAFYLNAIASGTTQEQENKYHLLRVLHNPDTRYSQALKETGEMLAKPDLWEIGKKKREVLLEQMPDPNDIFIQYMRELAK